MTAPPPASAQLGPAGAAQGGYDARTSTSSAGVIIDGVGPVSRSIAAAMYGAIADGRDMTSVMLNAQLLRSNRLAQLASSGDTPEKWNSNILMAWREGLLTDADVGTLQGHFQYRDTYVRNLTTAAEQLQANLTAASRGMAFGPTGLAPSAPAIDAESAMARARAIGTGQPIETEETLPDGTVVKRYRLPSEMPLPSYGGGGAGGPGGGAGGVGPQGALSTDKETARAQIIRQESGGNPAALNYVAREDPTAYARGATAGGLYGITDSNWAAWGKAAGVDTQQYPTARSAPKGEQDKVFDYAWGRYGNAPWNRSTWGQNWVKGPDGRYTLQPTARGQQLGAATPGTPATGGAPTPGAPAAGGGITARIPGAYQTASLGMVPPPTGVTGPPQGAVQPAQFANAPPFFGPGPQVATPQQQQQLDIQRRQAEADIEVRKQEQIARTTAFGNRYAEIQTNAQNAPNTQMRLAELENAAREFTTGPSQGTRQALYRATMGALEMAGIDIPERLKNPVSGAEIIEKESGLLAGLLFKATNSAGAADIYNQVSHQVPGIGQSPQGFQAIVSAIRQSTNRDMQLRDFANQWLQDPRHNNTIGPDANGVTMEAAFNKLHPPETYASRVIPFTVPMQEGKPNVAQLKPNVVYRSTDGTKTGVWNPDTKRFDPVTD
jgi:hypothetical protein